MVISMKPCSIMATKGGHHGIAAQDYVLLHVRVAKVKVAVLKARGLVSLPGAVYLEGQLSVAAASTSTFAGTTSMSPVGILGFLLARSRTTPPPRWWTPW